MSFLDRSGRRRTWWLNAGFLYGAVGGMAFILAKTLKYSNGGDSKDVPWAILIILVCGLTGGALWQLGRALVGARTKGRRTCREGDDRRPRTNCDGSGGWHGSN